MRNLLLFFLMLMSLKSYAENSNYIGIWGNVHTYHLSRENKVNEENQLLGIQVNRLFFSTFDNSFDQRSYALGWRWLDYKFQFGKLKTLDWSIGLSPGLAYGYGNRFLLSFWNLTPGLIPSAGIEWNVTEQVQLGSEILYIWSEQGGVLMTGITAGWKW